MAQRQTKEENRIIQLAKTIGRQFIPNVGTLLLVGLLLWAQQARAISWPQAVAPHALPIEITYQGKLTDTVGDPVTGSVDMLFALYTDSTGGTALWSEAHTGGNAVPVQEGEFTVHLGSIVPLPDDIWENDLLYLGIRVGTDPEMTPREALTAVPRAVQSSIALTVPDRSITNAKMALSYWLVSPPVDVAVGSSDWEEVVSVDVDFPVDGVYLLFAKVISSADEVDRYLLAEIWDESGCINQARAINTHHKTGNGGRQTGTIVTVAPFSTGAHTIRLMAKMSASTGLVRGNTELVVIPLGQP